ADARRRPARRRLARRAVPEHPGAAPRQARPGREPDQRAARGAAHRRPAVTSAGVPDQHVRWDGRELVVRWRPLPFDPPPGATTQAYGICFTEDGRIVLVNHRLAEPYWNLPGGTLEAGETPEQALVREVGEEACARVLRHRYLG